MAATNQIQQSTERFLKEAFHVDGQVSLVKVGVIDGLKSMMFKLTDSKKKPFYITISK